jgi:hypothetical protein
MAKTSADLRLPKRPVTVELALLGAEPRSVDLYLAKHQDQVWRRQDMVDLLEQDRPFLPSFDRSKKCWFLFRTEAVVWVELPAQPRASGASEDEELELFELRRSVQVDLPGGKGLAGELLYSPQADGPRVLDYLNASGRYLHLWNEQRLFLINKAHVVRVLELDTPEATKAG